MNDNMALRLVEDIEKMSFILQATLDTEKRAIRLYDVMREKVYKDALSPEFRDKFGMR